tara:strand:- start:370 stop:1395 length:1026 start_codon:yes stop_codon:yes gene_type:complete
MGELVATEAPERSGPRSMGEIQEGLAQALTGSDELPQEDSSQEEPPSSDSLEAERQEDAELSDDSVVDEQPVDEPEGELSENDQPIYTIKADGEESVVSLNELVAGYQRGATYTQRTQELATERQALNEQLQTVPAQEAALSQTYRQYQGVLQQLRGQMEAASQPPDMDWAALERENPMQYLQLRELERQRAGEIQSVIAEQRRMQAITEQERSQKLQQHLAVQRSQVLEKIPEWSNGDVQVEDQRKLMEFGQMEGYSAEELGKLYDSRAVVILRKAMLYDQLTGGEKIQEAKSKIGSVRGGSRETTRRTRSRKQKAQRQRLRSSGKVDDAAPLLADLLAE